MHETIAPVRRPSVCPSVCVSVGGSPVEEMTD